MAENGMYLSSERLDAELIYVSMKNGEEKERTYSELLRQSISGLRRNFATDHNMSAYKFYDVPSTRKIILCNQARFDDLFFPYRTREILERDKGDHRTNILGRVPSGSNFIEVPVDPFTTSRCHRICTKRSTTIARVII